MPGEFGTEVGSYDGYTVYIVFNDIYVYMYIYT